MCLQVLYYVLSKVVISIIPTNEMLQAAEMAASIV
jgi:hypothetical protein